ECPGQYFGSIRGDRVPHRHRVGQVAQSRERTAEIERVARPRPGVPDESERFGFAVPATTYKASLRRPRGRTDLSSGVVEVGVDEQSPERSDWCAIEDQRTRCFAGIIAAEPGALPRCSRWDDIRQSSDTAVQQRTVHAVLRLSIDKYAAGDLLKV